MENNIDKIIDRWIYDYNENTDQLAVRPEIQKNDPETLAWIRENKPAVIARIKEIELEKEENAKHTIKIIVSGWEAHTIYIDDRKLEEEFERWGSCYTNDWITADTVREAYNNHIAREERKVQNEIEALQKKIEKYDGQDLPTDAEARQREKHYNDIHNEGGEGYVPHIVSKEEIERSKKRLAELLG